MPITEQIAEAVLARLADGEILTTLCREFDLSPSAFSHKAERDPEFGQRYARAREQQAHSLANDVVRIADEEEDPQKARIRSDARKWLAGRIDPANYADKPQDTTVNVNTAVVTLTVDQRVAEAKAILERAFGEMKVIEHEPAAAAQRGVQPIDK